MPQRLAASWTARTSRRCDIVRHSECDSQRLTEMTTNYQPKVDRDDRELEQPYQLVTVAVACQLRGQWSEVTWFNSDRKTK